MKKTILLFLLCGLLSCKKTNDFTVKNTNNQEINNPENQVAVTINKCKNTIKERFTAPKKYSWVKENPDSFGFFIENFKLKKYGSPILKYDGTEITTQNLHEAIFDIDTGTKDLQQCADAVTRLRAEYLFKTKKFGEIKFHFTSGDLMKWNDYKNGTRAFVNGNSVSFRKTENLDDSYQNFRNYLDLIFTYSGTISLNKETFPVTDNKNLKSGDVLITAGSPGHVVFIAGVSKNAEGKKLYLLAEGFTPAQSIHVLKNPFDPKISPWYQLDVNSEQTKTARYLFKPTNLRSF